MVQEVQTDRKNMLSALHNILNINIRHAQLFGKLMFCKSYKISQIKQPHQVYFSVLFQLFKSV